MAGLTRLAGALYLILAFGSLNSCRGAGGPESDAARNGDRRTTTASVQLKVGDPAPLFSLTASDGKVYSLADYRGKQAVVLAWFVKAFTGP